MSLVRNAILGVHSHNLSELTQSGASLRQIIEWNGTSWVAVTAPLFIVGTNARSAQIPDNTTAGGNARGNNAVDLQTDRIVAAAVASGDFSVIVGGRSNTSSGLESGVASGGFNTASGTRSFIGGGNSNVAISEGATVCGGVDNKAIALYSWIPGGMRSNTRVFHGSHAWSGALRATHGDNQHFGNGLQRETTDATPTILTSDRADPSAANVMVLPNNSSWNGIISVQAHDTSWNTAKWTIDLLAKRGANAAATSIVDQHVIRAFAEPALAGAAVTIVANPVRGSWEIQVTGLAATTIDWIADVTVGSLTHR